MRPAPGVPANAADDMDGAIFREETPGPGCVFPASTDAFLVQCEE